MSGRGLAEAERRLLARWGGAPEDLAALVMEIEAAAAREALPSVGEMAAALSVAFRQPWDPRRPDWAGLATAILAALRAARASDGGR